jgi:AcrR family transcriptional regulator
MDAAYVELSEHGWRGFSVDRVARNAKASKQTIYRWWKSAACLAVDAALGRLGEVRPLAANGGAADVRDRVAALIEPLLLAVRTGDGAHAWRGALLAAADDQEAGEIFRGWFSESVKIPLRHILAEQALKGAIRRLGYRPRHRAPVRADLASPDRHARSCAGKLLPAACRKRPEGAGPELIRPATGL